MTMQRTLLDEIQTFIAKRGISETTFGRLAVNDGKFAGRLRANMNVTVQTLERARQYIRDHADDMPRSRVSAAQ